MWSPHLSRCRMRADLFTELRRNLVRAKSTIFCSRPVNSMSSGRLRCPSKTVVVDVVAGGRVAESEFGLPPYRA
jgi:hypothetical protein